MKNTTPSGTRTLATSSPLGRTLDFDHLADRIGQRRDLLQTLSNPVDAIRIQLQAIDLGVRQPILGAAGCPGDWRPEWLADCSRSARPTRAANDS